MPNEITVATYNAKNFFDNLYPQRAKPQKEVKALARVIKRIGADVIGFQEVESIESLRQLNTALEGYGASSYKHLLFEEGNYYRDLHVPYVSRIKGVLKTHKNTTLKGQDGSVFKEYKSKQAAAAGKLTAARFQRDFLLFEFKVNGEIIAVFNTHFKSRSEYRWTNNSSDEIRYAESLAAKKIVEKYQKDHPDRPIIILGDLNQRHKHKTVKPLTKELGFFDPVLEELMGAGRDVRTYWRKKNDRIDYVLLSESAKNLYVEGSARIHTGSTAMTASDHFAVSVTLKV